MHCLATVHSVTAVRSAKNSADDSNKFEIAQE